MTLVVSTAVLAMILCVIVVLASLDFSVKQVRLFSDSSVSRTHSLDEQRLPEILNVC